MARGNMDGEQWREASDQFVKQYSAAWGSMSKGGVQGGPATQRKLTDALGRSMGPLPSNVTHGAAQAMDGQRLQSLIASSRESMRQQVTHLASQSLRGWLIRDS